jgi:uncharacterized repeat protein (TIGR03806 family)
VAEISVAQAGTAVQDPQGYYPPAGGAQRPGDNSRWYVINHLGYINKMTRTANGVVAAGVFADLTDRVLTTIDGARQYEMGLHGLAFDPQFALTGRVYVYYSAAGTQGTPFEGRLSRFQSLDGGETLEPGSEEVLIQVPRSYTHHWGGTLRFGADGMLYAAFGDGEELGGRRAQDRSSLLGKFIRIDVRAPSGYRIPPTNPFVGVANARAEIWALGLRNPWSWSFDPATGDLWAGDVGLNAYEEINRIVPGANYGWPVYEGPLCLNRLPCDTPGLTPPVLAYPHGDTGSDAVIGGAVYWGSRVPELRGTYLFADFAGQIFALRSDGAGGAYREVLATIAQLPYTWLQGADGEPLLAAGVFLWGLGPAGEPEPSNFPERLSQTGCVDPADPHVPAAGMIPYDVNAPLWSDGADKERWFALPEGTYIHVGEDGDWEFPVGSVLMKSFRIAGRLLETRLFVRHDDGDWAGYSYEWDDAETDATLLPAGKVRPLAGGGTWTYPSRGQCLACHTAAAGRTLGPETAQLGRIVLYPATGRFAYQLETLAGIGMLDVPPGTLASSLPGLSDPSDATLPIEARARAYLHANCAMCHRPGGPGQGPEDFRFATPTLAMGAIGALPTQSNFGIPGARLIAPGDPDRSILYHRIGTLGSGRMPPLASAVLDESGMEIIGRWIRSGMGMGSGDEDGDDYADDFDNCRYHPNPSQLDSDADRVGNLCDGDFNNDGRVDFADLAIFRAALGSRTSDARYRASVDMNGDGLVNSADLALFRGQFGNGGTEP